MSTTSEVQPRSKARRRRPPLDESKIVSAAIGVIRKRGVAGLSMRELARELGIVPMSIYHHIPNKEALLERIVDAAMASIPMPPPRADAWVEQMKAYTVAAWQALAVCPGLSEFALNRRPTEATRRLMRYGVSILRAAGFDEHAAALGLSTYHAHIFGLMTFEGRLSQLRRSSKRARARNAESGELIAGMTSREWMEFGIDVALEGLRAKLPPLTRA